MYKDIWQCAENRGCRVPRPKPSVTYPLKHQPVTHPLSRSAHVLRGTKIFGYVAKTSLCYICNGCGPRALLQANRFGTCPYVYIYIYLYICMYTTTLRVPLLCVHKCWNPRRERIVQEMRSDLREKCFTGLASSGRIQRVAVLRLFRFYVDLEM